MGVSKTNVLPDECDLQQRRECLYDGRGSPGPVSLDVVGSFIICQY